LIQKLKTSFGPKFHKELLLHFKPENQIFNEQVWNQAGNPTSINETLNGQLQEDFTQTTLPFLLKAADRNSMRWSVESRMPFADFVPLVELLFSIPGSAKVSAGFSKYLLRQAAEPFVPEVVLTRKDKIGFAAPNQDWLKALLDKNCFTFHPDFIDQKKFEACAKSWLKKPESVDFQIIWRAVAFQKWLEIFELD
jgi:asparagine synthase (glutamine-hydrolysing)